MAKRPTDEETTERKGTVDLSAFNAPKGYRAKRLVTTRLVSLTYNNDLAFRVIGEMSAQQSAQGSDQGKDKPMTVAPVELLEDGEEVTLIIPTVLESALRRVPGGYVGKMFLAKQGAKPKGKRYFDIQLVELEDG